MSLGSVVLLAVIWLAMTIVLIAEPLHDSKNRHYRHKYNRRHIPFSDEHTGNLRLHRDTSQPTENPPLADNNEGADEMFELDKPRECCFLKFLNLILLSSGFPVSKTMLCVYFIRVHYDWKIDLRVGTRRHRIIIVVL